MMPIKVVAIIATGFSGSTLLALMLSRYPEILSCSELGHFLFEKKRPLKCRIHQERCTVWTDEVVSRGARGFTHPTAQGRPNYS